MEPKEDSDELITPVLNFQIDVGRIQVPVTTEYPSGEGIILTVKTPLGQSVDTQEWISSHYLLSPSAAKAIGQGIMDTANEATRLYLPDDYR